MKIKKSLQDRFFQVWKIKLPNFKPILTGDIPKIEKNANYLCEDYLQINKKCYFLQIDYDYERQPWSFSIGIVISDNPFKSRHPPGTTEDALMGKIGSYGIWQYMEIPRYSWALYDPIKELSKMFPQLVLPSIDPIDLLWRPSNFGIFSLETLNEAVDDATDKIQRYFIPKMKGF